MSVPCEPEEMLELETARVLWAAENAAGLTLIEGDVMVRLPSVTVMVWFPEVLSVMDLVAVPDDKP